MTDLVESAACAKESALNLEGEAVLVVFAIVSGPRENTRRRKEFDASRSTIHDDQKGAGSPASDPGGGAIAGEVSWLGVGALDDRAEFVRPRVAL